MNNFTVKLNNWTITGLDDSNKDIKIIGVEAPFDITDCLTKNHYIEDINYSDNYLKNKWVNAKSWTAETLIEITNNDLLKDMIFLKFDGIDTFSEIYINDIKLKKTDNMFLSYKIDIKNYVKVGENLVKVFFPSIVSCLDTENTKQYPACFNNERVFVRKAQCQFGWDWAPDYKGQGIWQNAYLVTEDFGKIEYVRVRTRNSGVITLFTELDVPTTELHLKCQYRVVVSLRKENVVVSDNLFDVSDQCSILNVNIDKPKLWYPNGYGEQPIYDYKIFLLSNNEIIDEYDGAFAIREVEIREDPIGEKQLDCRVYINGQPIFLKGSNWVPLSPLSGAIDDCRYEKLIKIASDGNFNILRVWGGGIYEKDLFYNLCDEYGLLVWQDFMFACSVVADDVDSLARNITQEAVYQVKRLCNHPCIVTFNAGNELTKRNVGITGKERGLYIDFILGGICQKFSDVKYLCGCPYSYTESLWDLKSGDCHSNSLVASIMAGYKDFRDYIVKDKPLTTEVVALGPCRIRSLKKFIPTDKLNEINEIWDLHFVGNPYEKALPLFATLEHKHAESFFGNVNGLDDFVKKAMIVHAEILEGEITYARYDKKRCGGILNWMYNDNWPNGTWSVIDYELEPKAAYYAMKRSFETVYASFVKNKDKYSVVALNDDYNVVNSQLIYGQKTIDGGIIFENRETISLNQNEVFSKEIERVDKATNTYLYVKFNGKSTICFVNYYKDVIFKSNIQWDIVKSEFDDKKYVTEIEIKANEFAKMVFIDMPEKYNMFADDNYFDLEKGCCRLVSFTTSIPIEKKDISVKTFADVWDD